jgi:hypothetical protein
MMGRGFIRGGGRGHTPGADPLPADHDGSRYGPSTDPEPLYTDPLDPARLALFRDHSGRLRATIAGDRTFLDVRVARAFPFSDPERWFGLLDARDRSIGLLESLAMLDADSRAAAERALAERYFLPRIEKIEEMREEFGVVYITVETDHGRCDFVVKGIRDSIETREDGSVMFFDVDGNRFCIPDPDALDERSKQLLGSFL